MHFILGDETHILVTVPMSTYRNYILRSLKKSNKRLSIIITVRDTLIKFYFYRYKNSQIYTFFIYDLILICNKWFN